MGHVRWRGPVRNRVWQAPAAFIRSGCPRLAAVGHGAGFACGQRDQSGQAAARRGRAGKTSGHALPASGPAHAAFGELAARATTWPSRIA
jgi:hypothetical protein